MNTELISWSATQPNTGGAAAAFTGDSLTIKNDTRKKGPVRIVAIWANQQVEGWQQIVFPSGHDTTRNWRNVVEALEPTMRYPLSGLGMEVQPQELLSITIAGSNTAGDVETGHCLIHYPDLPGVNQQSIDHAELIRRGEKDLTIQATITGTAAGYSGSELITSESDLLQANRDYAVLGIQSDTNCGVVTLQGPDTGNVRIGCPGANTHSDMTSLFFDGLARVYGMPLIPIINSGNKANTFFSVGTNENAGATIVSANLVLLSK